MRGGEDGWTAPGAVDVEPEVVGFADLLDRREGVVGAKNGGAGCCVDEERCFCQMIGHF